MYIKFLENFDSYTMLSPEVELVSKEVHFSSDPRIPEFYPIMKLDDIEIHWFHDASSDITLANWNKRVKRLEGKRIFTWSSSQFFQFHITSERNALIQRFCNLPGFTLFLTEKRKEAMSKHNTIVKYVSQWEGKQQNDRTPWGFLKWDKNTLVRNIMTDVIKC